MKRVLYFLLLTGLSVACTRHYAIEDRAKEQITSTMDDYVESYFPGKKDWRMEGLKTVYANDSLCILQCSAWIHDSLGVQVVRDYRYIFLVDMDLSRANRKPVFMENYINTLCLTDKEIRQDRRRVRKTRENVYYTVQGGCVPVTPIF